jgi:hypothetical protein
VGGFIYTGGPLLLADLADRGVRYTGLAGVEWQGWPRTRETGRYQFELDGNTVSATNFTNPTCIFDGWLEDRSSSGRHPHLQPRAARHVFAGPRCRAAARPLQAAALGRLHAVAGRTRSAHRRRTAGKNAAVAGLNPEDEAMIDAFERLADEDLRE